MGSNAEPGEVSAQPVCGPGAVAGRDQATTHFVMKSKHLPFTRSEPVKHKSPDRFFLALLRRRQHPQCECFVLRKDRFDRT